LNRVKWYLPALLGTLLLLFTPGARAQIGMRTYTVTTATPDVGIGNLGSGIGYHQLSWNPVGTVTGCSVKLQQSADDSTWSDLIGAQTCTSAGQSVVTAGTANYIRIDPTTITLTAGSFVVFHWNGWNSNPAGGSISGTIANTQVAFGTAADTIGGSANFTYNDTTGALSLTGTVSNTNSSGTVDIITTATTTTNHSVLGMESELNTTIASPNTNNLVQAGALTGVRVHGSGSFTGTGGNSIMGLAGSLFSDNTGTIAEMSAVLGAIQINGVGGTITQAQDFEASALSLVAGTVSKFSGYHCDDMGTTATQFCVLSEGGQNELLASAGQTTSVLDVSNGATTTRNGLVTIRGNPLGDCSGIGDPCTLLIDEESFAGFGLYFKDKAAPAGSAFFTGFHDTAQFDFLSTDGTNTITLSFVPASKQITSDSAFVAPIYQTSTNCADSAGAAACGSAAAGSFVVDAGATTTVVSTTAVTADSEVFVQYDSSLGTRLGVTCNVTAAIPSVTARVAATSFTITVPAAPVTNPACYSYHIVN